MDVRRSPAARRGAGVSSWVKFTMPLRPRLLRARPPLLRPSGCADTVNADAGAYVASHFRCAIGKLTPLSGRDC